MTAPRDIYRAEVARRAARLDRDHARLMAEAAEQFAAATAPVVSKGGRPRARGIPVQGAEFLRHPEPSSDGSTTTRRASPRKDRTRTFPPRTCRLASCGRPFTPAPIVGFGSPPLYCSEVCRLTAVADVKKASRARRKVEKATAGPEHHVCGDCDTSWSRAALPGPAPERCPPCRRARDCERWEANTRKRRAARRGRAA